MTFGKIYRLCSTTVLQSWAIHRDTLEPANLYSELYLCAEQDTKRSAYVRTWYYAITRPFPRKQLLYCMYCIVLYVLYCMYCIVLYCIVCIVLYVLYCIVLYCMYCIVVLYCIVCIVLYVLYCMYCIVCIVCMYCIDYWISKLLKTVYCSVLFSSRTTVGRELGTNWLQTLHVRP